MGDLFRVSGSGNDFLAWIEPEEPPSPERVRAWCRRGVSLGADGLFTLHRTEDPTRLQMIHFNADGGRAELCGNGTRCAAQLAFAFGWATDEIHVVTDAGSFRARPAGPHRIDLEAPVPDGPPEKRSPDLKGRVWAGWWTRLGVPWFVVPWPVELKSVPLKYLGPTLRHHDSFAPEGANVAIVHYSNRHSVEMRFWERGVEAETLASGTGTLASVLVGLVTDRLDLPVEAVSPGGFPVAVRGEVDSDGLPTRWSLEGDARILARIEPWPGADQGS